MIKINAEELNLHTIMESGQCFRMSIASQCDRCIWYNILSTDKFIRACHVNEENLVYLDCTDKEFEEYWKNYFDLDADYKLFYESIERYGDSFLKEAAEYGKGMRILRQDYWETLVSFIISQNNNIPRIKNSIEKLCERFGDPIEKYGVIKYSFPYYSNKNFENFEELGLGYRKEYIYNIFNCDPENIIPKYNNLLKLPGVGPKVASCVMLYGWHDMTQYPIDTWMKKLLNEVYGGKFDLNPYKGFEGFIQQLQFYYYRHLKRGKL